METASDSVFHIPLHYLLLHSLLQYIVLIYFKLVVFKLVVFILVAANLLIEPTKIPGRCVQTKPDNNNSL
jgi:hypothetical protein